MRLIILMVIVLALGGCVTLPTAPSVTMAPPSGKPFDVFRSEFETCTRLAEQRLGKYYDYESSQDAQSHYDNVFMQCMLSYDNVVVSPVIRLYRIPRPPPQDYDTLPPD